MATWSEISNDIASRGVNGQDIVRREKLAALFAATGRPVILYAVDMFNQRKIAAAGGDVAIDLSDKEGFKEVLHGIAGDNLDVILHSPGGSPEATESIVRLLRSRFQNLRFIIPNIAKSAATMLAMSGNEIIMGVDAELGPTDPQMVINNRLNPAHAILQQFKNAQKDLSGNSELLTAWLPILEQYGPSLLVECQNAIKLTETLVKDWLFAYMLTGGTVANRKRKAANISKFLANKKHLSHGRAISLEDLRAKGVNIKGPNEYTPDLSVIIQDINIAVMQTFNMTGAYKMFENHLGRGSYKVVQVAQRIQLPLGGVAQPQPQPPQQPQAPRTNP
jgi:hypothetical protein